MTSDSTGPSVDIRISTEVPDVGLLSDLYVEAALRRPVDDPDRMARMFAHSNVVRSAWVGERLVGLLRGWTDKAFDGWVSDLAVHPDFQSAGVGKALLACLDEYGPDIQWALFASPLALEYYGRRGWKKSEVCWSRERSGWNPGEPLAWRDRIRDRSGRA